MSQDWSLYLFCQFTLCAHGVHNGSCMICWATYWMIPGRIHWDRYHIYMKNDTLLVSMCKTKLYISIFLLDSNKISYQRSKAIRFFTFQTPWLFWLMSRAWFIRASTLFMRMWHDAWCRKFCWNFEGIILGACKRTVSPYNIMFQSWICAIWLSLKTWSLRLSFQSE